jgi:hypothetical protein
MNNEACQEWLNAYNIWRANPSRKMHELPKKPKGFDLWLQGSNPLALDHDKGSRCRGGGLVPESWTSSASPIPLSGEYAIQQPLL